MEKTDIASKKGGKSKKFQKIEYKVGKWKSKGIRGDCPGPIQYPQYYNCRVS